MKTIIIISLLLFSGCGLSDRVTPAEYKTCEMACAPNNGVELVKVDGAKINCRCNNGARFWDLKAGIK